MGISDFPQWSDLADIAIGQHPSTKDDLLWRDEWQSLDLSERLLQLRRDDLTAVPSEVWLSGRDIAPGRRRQALDWLKAALNDLGEHARRYNIPLIYEPLNRYETNLINTEAAGAALMESLQTDNVRLLADLFHMNIEETSIASGVKDGGRWIGHVHFVDSNRRPAGCGHLDYEPILAALREIQYEGYLSAEALPWPDPVAAAKQTIDAYRQLVG